MARNKPIPRSQRLIFNRGEKISRNSPGAKDDVKNVSVGIMDMDSSILYYFNEVIKPEVTENKEKVKDYTVNHTANIYLLDEDNNVEKIFVPGTPFSEFFKYVNRYLLKDMKNLPLQ